MAPKDINDFLLNVATKIGELTAAVESQGKSITALFNQTREIRNDISSLKTDDIPDLKINLSNLKLKVVGLGIAGGFLAKLFLGLFGFFKKLPWGE